MIIENGLEADKLIPLIIIEGPTASGKSSLAFELAKRMQTEIVSADSRQIYRYMDVGTAKPSQQQLQEVPHHLIDIINPDEEYSAGRFVDDASVKISEIFTTKGKYPIIAGGTGFYIQALLEGLFAAPPINEEIRDELDRFEREEGSKYLHSLLENLDPEAAKKIHPNDSYRLKRALEVWIATGKAISDHWSEQKENICPYKPFRIMITEDREALYQRINLRLEQMVANGLLEEIRAILGKGYQPTDQGLISVGYKELLPYIIGDSSFLACLEEAKKNTRNYAKRQLTWYRKVSFDLQIRKEEADIDKLITLIKNYFESC